jgi:hypothetical protein
LAVVTAAWLAAPAISRADVIHDYVFQDASTVLMSTPETITGSFTFDVTTGVESSVEMTLSGDPPYAATYTESIAGYPCTDGFSVCGYNGTTELLIHFDSLLDVSPDPLFSVQYFPMGGVAVRDLSPTGEVVFASVTATPEPASFALLGIALGGLIILGPRANRRDRHLRK